MRAPRVMPVIFGAHRAGSYTHFAIIQCRVSACRLLLLTMVGYGGTDTAAGVTGTTSGFGSVVTGPDRNS